MQRLPATTHHLSNQVVPHQSANQSIRQAHTNRYVYTSINPSTHQQSEQHAAHETNNASASTTSATLPGGPAVYARRDQCAPTCPSTDGVPYSMLPQPPVGQISFSCLEPRETTATNDDHRCGGGTPIVPQQRTRSWFRTGWWRGAAPCCPSSAVPGPACTCTAAPGTPPCPSAFTNVRDTTNIRAATLNPTEIQTKTNLRRLAHWALRRQLLQLLLRT